MNILILILVAIVITAVTGKLNEFVNYVVNIFAKEDMQVKASLAVAMILGVIAGVSLQIGIVQSVMELFGTQTQLSDMFKYVDIGFTCVGLSAGAGFFVGIIEKYNSTASEIVTTK